MNVQQIKKAVRERDGYRCTECSMTDEAHRERWGKGLEVHRLEPGSTYTIEGCITLCKRCHGFKPRCRHRPRQPARFTAAVVFAVKPEVRERIRRVAKSKGMRMSSYIRMAIVMRLERDEADEMTAAASH